MARTKLKPASKGKGPLKVKKSLVDKQVAAAALRMSTAHSPNPPLKVKKSLTDKLVSTAAGAAKTSPKKFQRNPEGQLLKADGTVFKKRKSGRCMKSKRMIHKLQKSTNSITARAGVRRAITSCILDAPNIRPDGVRCTQGSVDSMRVLTEATFIMVMRKAVDLLVFRGGRILQPKDVVCALMQMKFGPSVMNGIRLSTMGSGFTRLNEIVRSRHLC